MFLQLAYKRIASHRLQSRCLVSSMTGGLSVSIRARSPLELRAVWSEDITFPTTVFDSKRDESGKWFVEERSNGLSSIGETKVRISVPRRCTQVEIEAESEITLTGEDRLEVEQVVSIRSETDINLDCTIRGQAVECISRKGAIKARSAIEGVEVELTSGAAVYARRIGARLLSVTAGGEVNLPSVYADDVDLLVERGDATLGPVHGSLKVKVNNGDLAVESVSGTISADVSGKADVHLEESSPDSINRIHCGGQAKVTLAVTMLPVTIRGVNNVIIADSDVQLENGRLELRRPSGDGSGTLVVQGDDSSTISLLSWIESVMLKAAKKHGLELPQK